MKRLWRRFLAWTRLDKAAVCEMSIGREKHDDYHDYPDADPPYPWHMHTHRCRRCGKEFTI